ncbi:DUF6884 domain-containing protein [Bosea sp. NPDC003192]|uniref:DUF6884 domain-containing protein n=1 Tax=Bosea sp. NPDC003192 TaxID=3390551 RepID=UPI003D036362
MAVDGAQGELFAPVSYTLRPALIGADGAPPFIVIGCSGEKRREAAPAKKLYTSRRFKASIALADALAAPHAVLSAKHGIVASETLLEPYDLHLSALSGTEQDAWARQALEQLRAHACGRNITLLASSEYVDPLVKINNNGVKQLIIQSPWSDLGKPDIGVWLNKARRMAVRIRDLRLMYSWIENERRGGRVFNFWDLPNKIVPKRGVYIFLDRRELNFLQGSPRIVRIGTHGVSQGSMATLRGRLRNHLGPATEVGNHRGSIFRLHVGRAMLEAEQRGAYLPTWGAGQDASVQVKAVEVDHEIAVSRYLRELEVALIAIDDEPAKESLRASVEAQLIALCSEGMHTIDVPSSHWLGRNSPVALIRGSGLWNIRGVGADYDPSARGSVSAIVGG